MPSSSARSESATIFRFGPFVFHDASGQLMQRGVELSLSPRARHALRLLLWLWPRSVQREACCDPDVMDELHLALGAEARNGDGLIAHEVESIAGPPFAGALVLPGGARHPLYEGESSVGRADDNAVVLHDVRISRHHAQITALYGRAWIRDLGSKNGTFVAGRRIGNAPVLVTRDTPLHFGGRSASIVLGSSDIDTSERADGDESRRSAPAPSRPILHVPLW